MMGGTSKNPLVAMKIDLIGFNAVIIIFCSYLWFKVLPSLFASLRRAGFETDVVHQKLLLLIVISFGALAVIDVFFIRKIFQLDQKQREALDYMEIDSQGTGKIESLEKEIEFYSTTLSLVLKVLLIIFVFLIFSTLISPMYNLSII
ncbi:hypothetical protein J7K24_00490 [bacterium]|nr:hypothetical protein [bacterium]